MVCGEPEELAYASQNASDPFAKNKYVRSTQSKTCPFATFARNRYSRSAQKQELFSVVDFDGNRDSAILTITHRIGYVYEIQE